MRHRIIKFLQLIFQVPRPNMIWGDKVENKWNLMTGYLYMRYIFGAGSGQIYGIWNVIQSSLLFYLAFANRFIAIMISVIGILGFFILGHILVVIGFQKQEANLSNSQNPVLMKIKNDVDKILIIVSELKNEKNLTDSIKRGGKKLFK